MPGGGRDLNTLLSTNFILTVTGASAEMSRLFDLDLQLLADAVLTMIAVFALFLTASHFLFNPVRDMLNKRQEKIRGELEEAAREQEDALNLRLQYEEKLKNIDKEAERILNEAHKKALENEKRIIAGAKEEAAGIIERAQIEAELEKKKAVDDVKREMVSIASLMAGKIVAASIDTKVQDTLIDETLKEIGESTWLS